ncbi:outer membrane lipoprotein carrier protein [Alteromonadaceae bacterium Bs31]|nr:outer membrane lipoprotein carrier protein [Alteromonadaceae bacterium Bs31]
MRPFLFIILLSVITPALATPAEDLSKKLKAIDSFSARFEQSLLDPEGKALQETAGSVQVKQPGMFRWNVEPPFEQEVVANDELLWIYDADLEQVTISDRKRMDNSPAQILSGDFSSLENKYTVSTAQKKKQTVYTMQSLQVEKTAFTELRFVFDKKNILQAMVLVDKLGQTTEVVFSKQQINLPLDKKLFNFEPPEGVDVIQGTR